MGVVCFLSTVIISIQLAGFYPNTKVNNDTSGFWYQDMASIAANPKGDTLYCVFLDHRYGFHDFPGLTIAKSSDCGETWSENILIYYGEWDAEVSPSIAVDSQGWLHVVFGFLSPGGVWYTKSTDGGNNWISPVMISDTVFFMQSPILIEAGENDNLYVMWHYYHAGISDGLDIFFTKSTDHGDTWLHPNVIVNDSVSCMNWSPSFCLSRYDTIYAVWHDDRLPSSHIFFSRSIDDGLTWLDSNIKVDPDTNNSNQLPKIAIDKNNNLYCVWVQNSGNNDCISVSKSIDYGNTWSSPNTVSDSMGQVLARPSFDIDSLGNIYISWEDCRQDSSDIFFSFSSNGGANWLLPNLKVNDDNTLRPQCFADILVLGPEDVYVVWTDSRADTFIHSYSGPDIYFARGDILSNISEKNISKVPKLNLQIYPNPFRKTVNIRYYLESDENNTELIIFDSAGRLINQIDNLNTESSASFIWDGMDESGNHVPPGIYFVVLKTSNLVKCGKAILIK